MHIHVYIYIYMYIYIYIYIVIMIIIVIIVIICCKVAGFGAEHALVATNYIPVSGMIPIPSSDPPKYRCL